jgi:hypothetical protein
MFPTLSTVPDRAVRREERGRHSPARALFPDLWIGGMREVRAAHDAQERRRGSLAEEPSLERLEVHDGARAAGETHSAGTALPGRDRKTGAERIGDAQISRGAGADARAAPRAETLLDDRFDQYVSR